MFPRWIPLGFSLGDVNPHFALMEIPMDTVSVEKVVKVLTIDMLVIAPVLIINMPRGSQDTTIARAPATKKARGNYHPNK